MRFWERHWFDVGGVLGILLAIWLAVGLGGGFGPTGIQLVLWVSLLSLFAHQVEEWRWPGWFPGMLNVVLFRSTDPWRFPLNVRSGLVVNVALGWLAYLLAALLGERALWLGVATILVSVGNCVLHLIVIPIRGRMPYNPGMATSLVLFVPITVWFFVTAAPLMSPLELAVGIVVGIVLDIAGVVGLIKVMADPNAPAFEPRQVEPALRFR